MNERELAEQREGDFAVLREIGEAFRDVPSEEIECEVAKALAEVRAENRERDRARQAPSRRG